jgi:hypothetical protein
MYAAPIADPHATDPYAAAPHSADPYSAGPYAGGGPYPPPSGDLPTSVLGGMQQAPPPSGGPRRSVGSLLPAITAAVLVLVAAAAVIVVVTLRHGSGTGVATPPATTTATSTSGTKNISAEKQAATTLDGLLSQTVGDRSAVINAVTDVRRCGPSLRQDARTFSTAASSRRTLLSKLGSMTGRSALPASMLQHLTSAWQASAEVDTDLSRWAGDEIGHGCRKNDQDSNLGATNGPDTQATAGKQAFARQWNPIARRYALTTYHWQQL